MIKNRKGITVALLTLVALIAYITIDITDTVNLAYIAVMTITFALLSLYCMSVYNYNKKAFKDMEKVTATVTGFKNSFCALFDKSEVTYTINGKIESKLIIHNGYKVGDTVELGVENNKIYDSVTNSYYWMVLLVAFLIIYSAAITQSM